VEQVEGAKMEGLPCLSLEAAHGVEQLQRVLLHGRMHPQPQLSHRTRDISQAGHLACVAKGRVVLDSSLPQTLRLTSSP
jgi:hypothetical protein